MDGRQGKIRKKERCSDSRYFYIKQDKKQLLDEITSKNYYISEQNKNSMNLDDINKICKTHKISTFHKIKKVIPGWEGKPKGLLQVLWERGWINKDEHKKYRMCYMDDSHSCVDKYSLLTLMDNCEDFKNEITQIEHFSKELDVEVIFTTKYHPELAGEGIEYSWGVAKSVYRKIRLENKKGKENFIQNVKTCLSSKNVLTKENVRKFSKRARAYLQCYYSFGMDQIKDGNKKSPKSVSLIDNMTIFRKLMI